VPRREAVVEVGQDLALVDGRAAGLEREHLGRHGRGGRPGVVEVEAGGAVHHDPVRLLPRGPDEGGQVGEVAAGVLEGWPKPAQSKPSKSRSVRQSNAGVMGHMRPPCTEIHRLLRERA